MRKNSINLQGTILSGANGGGLMNVSATPDGLFRGSTLLRGSAKDLLAFTNKSSDAGWRAWEWWWVHEKLFL